MAVDNLRAQLQLNEAIRQRSRLLQAQTQEMRGQVELALELSAVSTTDNVDDMLEKLEELKEGLAEAREAAADLNETQSGLFSGMLSKVGKVVGAVGGLVGGLLSGIASVGSAVIGLVGGALKILWKTFTGLASAAFDFGTTVLKTVISGVWELSKAIIAAPFKMLSAFIEAASDIQVYEEMVRAIEKVRGVFGALNQTLARDVIQSFKNVQSTVKGASLSAGAAFGFAHERLEFFMEKENEMGAVFAVMSDTIRDNATEFGWLIKGMDLTGEVMKSLGERALTFGKTIFQVGEDINDMSQQMVAEGFAKSAKIVSKAMAQMIHDVGNFGTLTIREIGVAVVYFKNLGVEIEKIVGLVDAFDNFDDAAKRVSQLSQAFGVHVDVVKMMEEQNPAKRADMLRQAFFATGQTVENMTRQEQKLLAETMNLDVATSNLLFSQKNMGRSYDQINNRAKAAEKSPLTQAVALQRLADAIERIVHILDPHKGGIFENFFKGFQEGVMGKEFRFFTPELRKQMMQIRDILLQVRMLGVRVGGLFVKFFPPMVKFREAIDGLFKSERWAKAIKRIEALFEEFFKHPREKMGDLIRGLGDVVRTLFPREVTDAFIEMFRSLGLMAAQLTAKLFDWFLQGLTWVLEKLVVFLRTPGNFAQKVMTALGEGFDGARSEISPLFQPFLDAWNDNQEALGAAASTLWDDHLKPGIINAWNEFVQWLSTEGVGYLSQAKTAFIDVGKELIQYIVDGIKQSSMSDLIGSSIGDMLKSGLGVAFGMALIVLGGPAGLVAGLGIALGNAFALLAEIGLEKYMQEAISKSNAYVNKIAETMRSTAHEQAAQGTASEILMQAYGSGFNKAKLDELTDEFNKAQQSLISARSDYLMSQGTMWERNAKFMLDTAEEQHGSVMSRLENVRIESAKLVEIAATTMQGFGESIHATLQGGITKSIDVFNTGFLRFKGMASTAESWISNLTSKGKTSKPGVPEQIKGKATKLSDAEKLVQTATPGDLLSAQETIKMAKYVLNNARVVDSAIVKIADVNKRAGGAVGYTTSAVNHIAGMIKEINAVAEHLDSINAINLTPTLQRFASTITGSGKFTINNKKFSIDINLAVKIDGKSIATAIARPLSEVRFKATDEADAGDVMFRFDPAPVISTPAGGP